MNKVKFNESILKDAEKIVDECMGEASAFCQSRCPMHTDVKKYVNLIGEKKYDEAVKVIREQLFLPNTLGRICAHPCEMDCRRSVEYNQPLSIAALKRFAAEQADDEKLWDLTKEAANGKSVAIIGAGPAGAQAAINLSKLGYDVTIYDKLEVLGGMMRVGIPAYRLPRDIIDYEYTYLDKLGVKFEMGVEIGKDISFEQLKNDYDAVLLAHGAHKGNVIPMPGHKSEGVFPATEYLMEISLTQAFTGAGKRIMVIGGGDVAMDCARSSLRIGAEEVYQCSLEDFDNLPASEEEIHESLKEGILFNAGWGPVEIISKDNKVTGIKMKRVNTIFDEVGNFAPTYHNEERTIEVDTVVMAAGQLVEDVSGGMLEQTRGGRFVVDKATLATSVENIFVAGDACGSNIVVEAMALGRKAAISIDRSLQGVDLLENRDLRLEEIYETNLEIPLPNGTVNLQRLHTNMRPIRERIRDFEQADLGFTEEQALKESSRCLSCECKLCMKECIMMNDFGECPKEIMLPLAQGGEMNVLMAYSCNGCDNCTIVCPHELPMKKIFVGARKDYVAANDGESPIPGHKAIKIHQILGFSKLFTTKKRGGK
ncbi:MAG: oxidoreductase [Firmicutes bacterium HGW-Firmicutes-5]|nr:MAG: oxidoreductase [Firmicutes bacterium HGW-Firmicutes-5]